MEPAIIVIGTLLAFWFSRRQEPVSRFLLAQNQTLRRVLRDHGVEQVVCTPAERSRLLAIGAELQHQVRDIFVLNTWKTYQRWLRELKSGKEPGRPGRKPKFSAEDIETVLRIARENISFGLGRIAGELKKLGILMSRGKVKSVLRENKILPPDDRQHTSPGNWQKLFANLESLVACDFFTKPIYSLLGKANAYVLVFIHLGTRKVWMSPATVSPNDDWCRKQAIHAAMWIEDQGLDVRHLIRDNDTKFTKRFDQIFKDLSPVKDDEVVIRTGIRMPKMNAYAESFVGHLKIECLDHFCCFTLDQLDGIVYEYMKYHNNFRPHQGKDIGNRVLDPDWQPPPPKGKIRRKKIFRGLLNHYYRDAA